MKNENKISFDVVITTEVVIKILLSQYTRECKKSYGLLFVATHVCMCVRLSDYKNMCIYL